MASQLETSRTDPGPGKRAELLGDMDNFSEEDDDGEASDEEAQMATCYCFGGPTLNAFCMAPDLVSPKATPPPSPARPSGAKASAAGRGRALRILVVGSSTEKQRVIDALRSGGSLAARQSRATSVGSKFAPVKRASLRGAKSMLIFNDVPSRDLDRPRYNSDFEAYLQRASCTLIVVDASDAKWLGDAKRWSERLRETAELPVALLVDCASAASASSLDQVRAAVAQNADALAKASSLPFVGWFVASDDASHDETADCVSAIVDWLDNPPPA